MSHHVIGDIYNFQIFSIFRPYFDRSIDQPINQPTNQSIDQSINRSLGWLCMYDSGVLGVLKEDWKMLTWWSTGNELSRPIANLALHSIVALIRSHCTYKYQFSHQQIGDSAFSHHIEQTLFATNTLRGKISDMDNERAYGSNDYTRESVREAKAK